MNRRPSAPKADALPNCAIPRMRRHRCGNAPGAVYTSPRGVPPTRYRVVREVLARLERAELGERIRVGQGWGSVTRPTSKDPRWGFVRSDGWGSTGLSGWPGCETGARPGETGRENETRLRPYGCCSGRGWPWEAVAGVSRSGVTLRWSQIDPATASRPSAMEPSQARLRERELVVVLRSVAQVRAGESAVGWTQAVAGGPRLD